MKRNYVKGVITSGIFKDKLFEINIGSTPEECKILINGKPVTDSCLSCNIKMAADKPFTTVWMEFVKRD